MCLQLKKLAFKHFALTDVVVYKHLKCDRFVSDLLYTPYRFTSVSIGETYKSDLIKEHNSVDFGLHSFKHLIDAVLDGESEGSHVVVKCIIPRGSWYYKGIFFSKTSYASNRIKYVEIVKEIK